jgi:hypothetical protein
MNEETLRTLFSVYPGGVKRVFLNRNYSKLIDKVEERDKVAMLLESAETELIKAAVKEARKRKKLEEQKKEKERQREERRKEKERQKEERWRMNEERERERETQERERENQEREKEERRREKEQQDLERGEKDREKEAAREWEKMKEGHRRWSSGYKALWDPFVREQRKTIVESMGNAPQPVSRARRSIERSAVQPSEPSTSQSQQFDRSPTGSHDDPVRQDSSRPPMGSQEEPVRQESSRQAGEPSSEQYSQPSNDYRRPEEKDSQTKDDPSKVEQDNEALDQNQTENSHPHQAYEASKYVPLNKRPQYRIPLAKWMPSLPLVGRKVCRNALSKLMCRWTPSTGLVFD